MGEWGMIPRRQVLTVLSGAVLTTGEIPNLAAAAAARSSHRHAFKQVDVFGEAPLGGNPLAVVVGADGMSEAEMAAFARWTNLSETTFLQRPTQAGADYRVRIFGGNGVEFPFAGHPTLGTCHVWLETGGKPKGNEIVQECGVGLVRLRRESDRIAFLAPPLRRDEALTPDSLARICQGLGLSPDEVVASRLLDNGLEWICVKIASRERLLALKPDWSVLDKTQQIGLVAPWGEGGIAFEVRGLAPDGEDPVTGSLNASLSQWLMAIGLAPEHYIVSQGTVLNRTGRVHVDRDAAGNWVGGRIKTCIEGTLTL